MTRYLSGLCVAGLGLCGGCWLIVVAVAFGGESGGAAGQVDLMTGVFLLAVSAACLACWAAAWRRRLRADGILPQRLPAPGPGGAAEAVPASPPRQAGTACQADDELLDRVGEAEEAWW